MRLLWLAAIAGIALIVFSQYGFEGRLTRDKANLVYAAQQMQNGIPPLVSLFNHSGPLPPLMGGMAVAGGRFLNSDDTVAVRFAFAIIAALAVASTYLLGITLFKSEQIGLLSAALCIGSYCFGSDAVSGPRTKIPLVLFESLSLFFASKKNWLAAGVSSSLAMLSWQPAGVFVIAIFVTAFIQAPGPVKRIRNIAKALLGTLIPIAGISSYYLYMGAFSNLVDGTVLFNIKFVERQPQTVLQHIAGPLGAIIRGYAVMMIPIVLGFIAMCLLYRWRYKESGSETKRLLSEDSFTAMMLSFPMIVIWSLIDFQGCPDFFIFLPFVAVGFGWLCTGLIDRIFTRTSYRSPAVALVVSLLILSSGIYYRIKSDTELRDQRVNAARIEAEFPDQKIISIGAPDLLVLLRRTNLNPYVFIASGIDNLIESTEPGGFEGWLSRAGIERSGDYRDGTNQWPLHRAPVELVKCALRRETIRSVESIRQACE